MLCSQRLNRSLLAAVCAASCAALCLAALPAAADAKIAPLDSRFGSEGRVLLPRSAGSVTRLVPQADGAILIAGSGELPGQKLLKLRRDGSIDSSFPGGGLGLESSSGVVDFAEGRAGSIIALSGSGEEYSRRAGSTVTRLGASGQKDPLFGSGGSVALGSEVAGFMGRSLLVSAAGRVVVGGYAPSLGDPAIPEAVLIGLGELGIPDPAFGALGVVRLGTSAHLGEANSIAFRGDGSILIGGAPVAGHSISSYATLVYSNGQHVTNFAGPGYLTFGSSGSNVRVVRVLAGAGESILLAIGPVLPNYRDPDQTMLYSFDRFGTQTGFLAGGGDALANGVGSSLLAAAPVKVNEWGDWSRRWEIQRLSANLKSNPKQDRLLVETIGEGWADAIAELPDRSILSAGTIATGGYRTMVVKTLPRAGEKRALRATLTKPARHFTGRMRQTNLAGTASPGARIGKVRVAILRHRSGESSNCLWARKGFAGFRKLPRVNRGCTKIQWLAASGTARWTLRARRKLPTGNYTAYVRVFARGGGSTSYVLGSDLVRSFRVTRSK